MFCPKCKGEYSEGYYKCADCGVDLVADPPPQEDVQYVDMVEVFSTYNRSDIAFIRSVLDGEAIHYFFQGESSAMMIGAGSYARLLVAADEADRARELLQELELLERS